MSRDAVVAALTAPDLAAVVDLVVWVEEGVAHAANHLGVVRLHADGSHEVVAGVDPVASEDPMAFLPYEVELAAAGPRVSTDNAYPYAAQRILSLFGDADRSPDVAVVHTPRHYFPDEGGHAGEHGSLDVIQSRAPLVMSGPGVAPLGFVDDHARLVDVAPTLAVLSRGAGGGPARRRRCGARRSGAHGIPRTAARRGSGAGSSGSSGTARTAATCCTSREAGELPGVARLVERGLALRGGAVAEFPSVTLTNHTSILTGVGPGRHGVLGNVYYDRATRRAGRAQQRRDLAPQRGVAAPGVRTVFEMVNDHVPQGDSPRTASVDEAIDRGADYGTMALLRAAGGFEAATNGHGRPAAGPGRVAVRAAAGAPGGRVLPLGRAGRRHGAAADAPALGERRGGADADLVGARRDRRRAPRGRTAVGDGAGLVAAERCPAGGVPRPPRGASGCSTR